MVIENILRWEAPLLLSFVWTISITLADQSGISSQCEDQIEGKIVVDPKLNSDFFISKEASYPWYVISHNDGTFEDTLDGEVSPEDLVKIEHTAQCISSHQGKHVMSFCSAEIEDNQRVRLVLEGGLPAYASALVITIDREKNFKCAFEATYPASTPRLSWKITKKILKAKSNDFTSGARFYAWISVEFEEGSLVDGKMLWKPHKIEGFLKPIMQKTKVL